MTICALQFMKAMAVAGNQNNSPNMEKKIMKAVET